MYNRQIPCGAGCACRGKGWQLQLTYAKGAAHLLRVMHSGKKRGTDIRRLVDETERTGRELLMRCADELEIQLAMPLVMPYRIEIESKQARKVLEALVPAGHTVAFSGPNLGGIVTIDKSSFGGYGAADLGFDDVQDAEDWINAGRNARSALDIAQTTRDELRALRDEVEARTEILRALVANDELELKLIHRAQMNRAVRDLDDG